MSEQATSSPANAEGKQEQNQQHQTGANLDQNNQVEAQNQNNQTQSATGANNDANEEMSIEDRMPSPATG